MGSTLLSTSCHSKKLDDTLPACKIARKIAKIVSIAKLLNHFDWLSQLTDCQVWHLAFGVDLF